MIMDTIQLLEDQRSLLNEGDPRSDELKKALAEQREHIKRLEELILQQATMTGRLIDEIKAIKGEALQAMVASSPAIVEAMRAVTPPIGPGLPRAGEVGDPTPAAATPPANRSVQSIATLLQTIIACSAWPVVEQHTSADEEEVGAIISKMLPTTSHFGQIKTILAAHGWSDNRFAQRPNLAALRRNLVDALCSQMKIDLEELDVSNLSTVVEAAITAAVEAPQSPPPAPQPSPSPEPEASASTRG